MQLLYYDLNLDYSFEEVLEVYLRFDVRKCMLISFTCKLSLLCAVLPMVTFTVVFLL